jgi:hypothetical protein
LEVPQLIDECFQQLLDTAMAGKLVVIALTGWFNRHQ